VHPSIVPALTVLAMSITPEKPVYEPLPALDDLANLSTMISLNIGPDALAKTVYNPASGVVKVPKKSIDINGLKRLQGSNEVGFLVWSEQDATHIMLRSYNVHAYRWKQGRLILGIPRDNKLLEHPRYAWLGKSACQEEVPKLPFPEIGDAWDNLCQGKPHIEQEDMDAWLARIRDMELRAWGELLKAAQMDENALEPEYLEQFDELSATYRRHAALHHALMWANNNQLERALDRLDEARMMGRRYDVNQGPLTTQRIQQLGEAWLLRSMIYYISEQRDEKVLELYDLYPHWAERQPDWFRRQLARTMRRQGRPDEAIELYNHIIPRVEPAWVIYGELATAYLEEHDAFKARAIQLWMKENKRIDEDTDTRFTVLVQRAEHRGFCPPDHYWSAACSVVPTPETGAFQDLLISERMPKPPLWAEIFWGSSGLAFME